MEAHLKICAAAAAAAAGEQDQQGNWRWAVGNKYTPMATQFKICIAAAVAAATAATAAAAAAATAAAAAGVKKLTTETGAGQWGSALAFATCLLDMECEVGDNGSTISYVSGLKLKP
jgi:hypothetical protein